jgi:hypothetical protein
VNPSPIILGDGYRLPFASCYFNDGAGIIFKPLLLTARDRFNAIVRSRRKSPQQVNILAAALIVKPGGDNEQINVTPGIRISGNLRTEYYAELYGHAFILQSAQIFSYTI